MNFNLIDSLLEEQMGKKNKLLLGKKKPSGKTHLLVFALIILLGFDEAASHKTNRC